MGNRMSKKKDHDSGILTSSKGKANLHGLTPQVSLANATTRNDSHKKKEARKGAKSKLAESSLTSIANNTQPIFSNPSLGRSSNNTNTPNPNSNLKDHSLVTNPESYETAKDWSDWAIAVLAAAGHGKQLQQQTTSGGRDKRSNLKQFHDYPLPPPPLPHPLMRTETRKSLGFNPGEIKLPDKLDHKVLVDPSPSSKTSPHHHHANNMVTTSTAAAKKKDFKDAFTYTRVSSLDKSTMTLPLEEFSAMKSKESISTSTRSGSGSSSSSSSSDGDSLPQQQQRRGGVGGRRRRAYRRRRNKRQSNTSTNTSTTATATGTISTAATASRRPTQGSLKNKPSPNNNSARYGLIDPKVHANVAFENRNGQLLQKMQYSSGGHNHHGGNSSTISGRMHPSDNPTQPAAGAYNQLNDYTFKNFNASTR